jgi:hypothetical protein
MEKQVKYGFPGGFPLTQDTQNFMQKGYSLLENFAEMICTQQGSRYLILKGAIQASEGDITAISDGIIIFDGELLPLIGSQVQEFVHIEETIQTAIFMDESSKPVYVSRKVVFGEGEGQIRWADFKRIVERLDPTGSYPEMSVGKLGERPAADYVLREEQDSSGTLFAETGYWQSPDGLLVQWGRVNPLSISGGSEHYFPKAFKQAFAITTVVYTETANNTIAYYSAVRFLTETYFKVMGYGTVGVDCNYIAVGTWK